MSMLHHNTESEFSKYVVARSWEDLEAESHIPKRIVQWGYPRNFHLLGFSKRSQKQITIIFLGFYRQPSNQNANHFDHSDLSGFYSERSFRKGSMTNFIVRGWQVSTCNKVLLGRDTGRIPRGGQPALPQPRAQNLCAGELVRAEHHSINFRASTNDHFPI